MIFVRKGRLKKRSLRYSVRIVLSLRFELFFHDHRLTLQVLQARQRILLLTPLPKNLRAKPTNRDKVINNIKELHAEEKNCDENE